MKTWVLVGLIFIGAHSEARSTETGFYGSIGVGRNQLTIENAGHSSEFGGWSPQVGFGAIMPLGQKSAAIGGLEVEDVQVKNQSNSDDFIETLEGLSISARLGLQFGALGLGVLASRDSFDVKQVNAGGSSATTKIEGDGLGGFINYNLMPVKDYSISFEGAYSTGEANSAYTYTDISVGMKFYLYF